ncbi:MAG: hypothetical protein AAFW82_05115 [Pseudomonadota bacterium]
MQKLAEIIAVSAACLMAMVAVQSAVAEDRECKGDYITRTGGTADNEFWARKKARDAWRQKVEEKLDNNWSAWYLTKNREYSCFTEDGKHRCTAKAIPCRSKIVVQGPRKICDSYVIEGTGEAASIQEWAKHNARAKWSERAGMIVGDDFDTWLLANNRKVECKEIGDGKDVCTASATPCRYSIIN